MNKKEEILLSLSYWVSSLDGNIDVTETEHIISSENIKSFAAKRTLITARIWFRTCQR